jgi:FkbM family methyltransferase
MYIRGSYGTFYWDRLAAIKHSFVFLDIGANQGLYAIGAAQNPNCLACYAFEPVPTTYAYLRKNVHLNSVAGKVSTINAAISDQTGTAEILLKDGHSGGATMIVSQKRGSTQRKTIRIDLINAKDLDRLIPAGESPIMVKVDVEGFEPIVIDQLLQTTFAYRISDIFLEIDDDWVDAVAIQRQLAEAEFTTFEKIGSGTHYDLMALR